MRLRIGTRGSELALWQAQHVRARLLERGVEVEIVVLKTRGDRIDDVPLQTVEGKGFFTAEIEQALRAGEVDLAVHSHKDLPTQSPPDLALAAVPERGPRGEQLLVLPAAHDAGAPFLPLRAGARVGTSAPRRTEQLLALRPDLEVRALRGNVPTRVRRLREERYDAIVLAEAGLVRLALDTAGLIVVPLEPELIVPAPAQGALAIQVRAKDARVHALCREALHDAPTADAVAAERALLGRAGGGCNLPLGATVVPRAQGGFRAHGFLGAGLPGPGAPARWAHADGRDPQSAVAGLWAVLAAGAATCAGPLGGLRVALTGSASDATQLGARLTALGARVEHEAVIAFDALPQPGLAARMRALRRGDALALTSRRAAQPLRGASAPAGVTIAAVGPGSARALEEAGLTPTVVGTGGAAELAGRLELAPGARVLFPCAEDARDDLEQALRARGIEVERLPVYRTRALPGLALDPGCDARVYMSPSAVEAALPWELAHPGRATSTLALGRTTAAALARAGLVARATFCPETSTDLPLGEQLAGALARLRASRPHAAVTAEERPR